MMASTPLADGQFLDMDYLMAKGVCDDAVERMQMLLMHIRRALSRKRYVR